MKDNTVEKLFDLENHHMYRAYTVLMNAPEDERIEILVELFRNLAESHERVMQDYMELYRTHPLPYGVK